MSSGHPIDPGSLDPEFAKFREKKLTDKHARPAPEALEGRPHAAPPPHPHPHVAHPAAPAHPDEARHGDVGRSDPEFAKFREKKLTEQAADEIAKNEKMFFGLAPWEKKKEEEENAPRRMRLDELNLPGKDERPEGAPKQVGETFRLIDIALGNAPPVGPKPPGPQAKAASRPGARPQAPAGKPPARPASGPPAAKAPAGRPPAAKTPGARPPAPRPGGAPARPAAPSPNRARGPISPGKPSAPRPIEDGFMDRFEDARPSAPGAPVHHFEDTTFVEASEQADPYELKDDGSPADEFHDSADPRGKKPPARPAPPRGPAAKAPPRTPPAPEKPSIFNTPTKRAKKRPGN